MKKKTNRQIFEDLPLETHFKSVEKAAKIFRDMAKFVDSLGFDELSEGFLVLHRGHAPSGFDQEIPVCTFLKKQGFRVLLAEEFPHRKSVDANIDGIWFEIKQVAHAKNILRAILRQFRNSGKKIRRIARRQFSLLYLQRTSVHYTADLRRLHDKGKTYWSICNTILVFLP